MPEDMAHIPQVSEFCEGICLRRIYPRWAKLRSLLGFLHGEPLTLPYYRDAKLRHWVAYVTREHRIRKVVVFSSAMAQYVQGRHYDGLLRVIDFVDMDSDKWRQYGEKSGWPLSWIYRREADALLCYELKVAHIFDHALFVSREEVAHFIDQSGTRMEHVTALQNGVDLEYFDPYRDYENPYQDHTPVLVFTGAMNYWANVDAVTWFADTVFPKVRSAHENAAFYIVGANPSPEVMALDRQPGIYVTGRVPDVRPYLAHAALAVAPLRIARGVQNKVLEAMAMARAVFATPAAAEGLSAREGKEILVTADARQMAESIIEFLDGRGDVEMGSRAREFVEREYRWERNLEHLGSLLNG